MNTPWQIPPFTPPHPSRTFATAARLAPFGTTIFSTMTKLAQQHNAINLSQGFPDFDGPEFIKLAAKNAIDTQHNQYAPMPGIPSLRLALAERFKRTVGVGIDPDAQVLVTAGCTEAICAVMLGLIEPGDEVILIEPFYDSYRASVAMAGGTVRPVALKPVYSADRSTIEHFALDMAELERAFTPKTKAIMINTPHNPTGKVFSLTELQAVANLAQKHDVFVVSDEVYERLILDDKQRHISIASLPGMFNRTLTLSSLGKTFSFTGWKIGWAIGPANLVAAARAAHQFMTFAVATPLQHAAVEALRREEDAVSELVPTLRANRDRLASGLQELGMIVNVPAGAYFIVADFTVSRFAGLADPAKVLASGDASSTQQSPDQAFCVNLISHAGVAVIPPSVFYVNTHLGHPLSRWAFCKKPATIDAALVKLRAAKSMH